MISGICATSRLELNTKIPRLKTLLPSPVGALEAGVRAKDPKGFYATGIPLGKTLRVSGKKPWQHQLLDPQG